MNRGTLLSLEGSRRVPAPDIPQTVAPQLARLVKAPPSGAVWVHEVKFDGYRTLMRVVKGKARLLTRKGLDWTHRFPEISQDGACLPDCLIDGEICALDQEDITDFGALQQALSSGKTGALIYFVFDCLFASGLDYRKSPLEERKRVLEALLEGAPRTPHMRYVPHFAEDGASMLEAACKAGLEGIISKRLDAPYASGRGDTWTKSKCRGGQEVVIGGWRGDENTLRSLLVGAYEGDALLYMGRVGTGFPAKIAADLLSKLRPLRRERPPFSNPPRGRDFIYVEPKLVGEIAFENITSDRIFRQPSFKGLRLDKDAKSVVIETAENTAEATRTSDMQVKRAAARSRNTKHAGDLIVSGIRISHPDKVLWPKTRDTEAITKRALAEYFEAAAARMLPHIAGRPISVVRAPDGIDGEHFFQRHKLVGTAVPMLPIKVSGESEPYLGIADEHALVALAQAGVLEIHPWGSKKGAPDSPERIILDLDPSPELPFARVIEGAKEVRERLMRLGFTPFVKTTGGKGLHVVIAVKGTPKQPITWKDAKAFAKAMAVAIAADSPSRYTTTIAKKARTGKIFVDYLRNDRTSTGVAPWSPRARPRATIAVPIAWSQVKTGLDPQAFTIEASAPLLKRADAWADLAKSARPIAAAMRKMGAST